MQNIGRVQGKRHQDKADPEELLIRRGNMPQKLIVIFTGSQGILQRAVVRMRQIRTRQITHQAPQRMQKRRQNQLRNINQLQRRSKRTGRRQRLWTCAQTTIRTHQRNKQRQTPRKLKTQHMQRRYRTSHEKTRRMGIPHQK